MNRLAYFLAMIVLIWPACTIEQTAPSTGEKERAAAASGERRQYEAKMEAKLRQLNEQIDELRDNAAKQGKSAQKQVEETLVALEQKREAVRLKLENFKNATQAASQDMKPGIQAAMDDLEAAYHRAASHFK